MELTDFLLRWSHVLFGIAWIGLLYYFNFVQTEYLKEASAEAKPDVFTKLAPRALWWFRWGAMFTFLTGLLLLGLRGRGITVDIVIGSALGILMFLNVWLIIWPNQKIVIASNRRVLAGEGPLPEAAQAAPKAALASRTNTMFSIPMLFFMIGATHYPHGAVLSPGSAATPLAIILLAIAALEINAWVGKMGPMATVRGVLLCGLVLTVVFFGLLEVVM